MSLVVHDGKLYALRQWLEILIEILPPASSSRLRYVRQV